MNTLGQIFFFCNQGNLLTNRFEDFENIICQKEWYLFPIEIQKVLPIIINGLQDTVLLRGFGSIACTRSTFQNVNVFFAFLVHLKYILFFIFQIVKTGSSYFLVLREF